MWRRRHLQRPLRRGQLSRLRVSSVDRPQWFDEQDFRLDIRLRAMLNAARHYEQLSGLEDNIAVAQLNGEPPLEDQEEVVGVGVGVPDELALGLDDHHLVVVQHSDNSRTEDLIDSGEGCRQVDLVIHSHRMGATAAGTQVIFSTR